MKDACLLMQLEFGAISRISQGVQDMVLINRKIRPTETEIVLMYDKKLGIKGHFHLKFVHDYTPVLLSRDWHAFNAYSHRHHVCGAELVLFLENSNKAFILELKKPCYYAFNISRDDLTARGIKPPTKARFTYLTEENTKNLGLYLK